MHFCFFFLSNPSPLYITPGRVDEQNQGGKQHLGIYKWSASNICEFTNNAWTASDNIIEHAILILPKHTVYIGGTKASVQVVTLWLDANDIYVRE